MRKSFGVVLALVLIISIVLDSDIAEARRRRRGRKLPIINEKKLYERIGGLAPLRQLTDDWIRRALADSRLNSELESLRSDPAALGRFRTWLFDQSCELADGPCEAKDMAAAEKTVWKKLDAHQFLIFADHLAAGADQLRLVERDKNDLLARWGHFDRRPELSNAPTSAKSSIPPNPIPQMGPDTRVEKPVAPASTPPPSKNPSEDPAVNGPGA